VDVDAASDDVLRSISRIGADALAKIRAFVEKRR
jgi:hypothetical protein